MAFIDVLTYRGDEHTLVWKWFPIPPEEHSKSSFLPRFLRRGNKRDLRKDQLRLGTQLVVGPAQVAVFVKEGQIADISPQVPILSPQRTCLSLTNSLVCRLAKKVRSKQRCIMSTRQW